MRLPVFALVATLIPFVASTGFTAPLPGAAVPPGSTLHVAFTGTVVADGGEYATSVDIKLKRLSNGETIPLGPLQQISNSGWVGDFVLPPQATNGQYYLKAREQLAYSFSGYKSGVQKYKQPLHIGPNMTAVKRDPAATAK